ncbi:MAG: UDP-N-acetylmuramate dehydrogenase [Pseudomonadota bacterium]
MNACANIAKPRGKLRHGEPMSQHTVWACGGPAERFFEPADLEDLVGYVGSRDSTEPMFWLGLGSNLLVRDGGLRGSVIALAGALDGCDFDGSTARVQAGTPCAKLARAAGRAGLAGATFFAGIPGTVGGALAMNAGAFGGETWSHVRRVHTLDRAGALRWREVSEYAVGYRTVTGPADEWFVAAELEFERAADPARDARQEIRALLARRAASQPTGVRSCGSVFRNPQGDYAGRLIESCGLKGRRRGDAYVSEKHANFIINAGTATAADIEALIDDVRMTVLNETGIALQPEVCIVGEVA